MRFRAPQTVDTSPAAAPDTLALYSSIIASCSHAPKWQPFAFRLLRASAVMNHFTQTAAAEKFSSSIHEHALSRADVACSSWANTVLHAASVESTIQGLALQSTPASTTPVSRWVCSCCVFAADYAVVCAFFLDQGPNPLFIDVITGSACSCMPVGLSVSMGNNVISCTYANEFVAATDSMSLFLYRSTCFFLTTVEISCIVFVHSFWLILTPITQLSHPKHGPSFARLRHSKHHNHNVWPRFGI